MRFFSTFFLPLIGAAAYEQSVQEPLGNTDGMMVAAAPGIGIHFTTSYAIAVARHSNGTFQKFPRINGDSTYIDSMAWLADPESPVFTGILHGDLATEALATMLSRVRDSVESELKEQVVNAYAVFPVSQGLRREHIEFAFKLAGMSWLASEDSSFLETNAAYAGLGLGVCPSFPDMDRCQQEVEATQFEHVLFLNFDNSSFGAAYHPMHPAAAKMPSPNSYILDTYLGWWNLPIDEMPRTKFWSDVQEVIKDVVKPLNIAPSRIVLLGDHAADEEFKNNAYLALYQLLYNDAFLLLHESSEVDGSWLAAKGAAEWAFRIQHMRNDPKVRFGHKNKEKERMEL